MLFLVSDNQCSGSIWIRDGTFERPRSFLFLRIICYKIRTKKLTYVYFFFLWSTVEFICLFETFLSEIVVALQKIILVNNGLKRSRSVKSGYGSVKRSYGSGTLVFTDFYLLLVKTAARAPTHNGSRRDSPFNSIKRE
jgi:hypothetical protein